MRQATILASSKALPKVDYYYRTYGKRCVRIKGDFWFGGFSMSQNKVSAILENIETLKKFVGGAYNNEIDKLTNKEDSVDGKIDVLIPDC